MTDKYVKGEHFTTGEAAKELGVSMRTINNWCDTDILRCVTTQGGHRRVSVSSVFTMKQEMMKPHPASQYASLSGLPSWITTRLKLGPHYAIQIPAVKLEMVTEGELWRAYELRMYDALGAEVSSARMAICERDVATYPLLVQARMPGVMMIVQVDITYNTLEFPCVITNPIMKHYLVKTA